MDEFEKIKIAQRMQTYIHLHINENIALDCICEDTGYSKRHAFRIFKDVFNKTPFEYARALRLTNAAQSIKSNDVSILDVALTVGFDSHEGFTKAFKARFFGVTPSKYREHLPMTYMYFSSLPVLHSHLLRKTKEYIEMAENRRTVTVTIVEKSARKLILIRGKNADDYFSLMSEIGCDKWELLEAHPAYKLLDAVSFVRLPPRLIKPATSEVAVGLEVPTDYCGEIPEGFDVIDLPGFTYLWFQGLPYEDDEWYGHAHEEVYGAIKNYKPELYGYMFARDEAPCFVYGSSAQGGTREMIPVKLLLTK